MSSSDEICIVLPSDGEIESANGLERASRKKSSSKGSRSRSRSKGARRKSPSKGSRSKSPSKGLRSESPSKGSRSKSPSKASSSSVKGQPDPVPITIEEIEYREKSFAGLLVQKLKLLCTTCGKNLELSIPQAYQIASHPILDVLLCKTCADFYGEGDFSVDEDGTDKYCRWCGQGGTLYLCSDCNFGFCRACIKRNLHRSVLNDVNADDWKCFSCDSKPLWELRGICAATLEYIRKRKEKMKEEKLLSKSLKKAMISTSESESDTNSMKERRKKKRKIRRSPSVEKNERKKQKKEDKTFKKESSHVEAKTVKYSKNLDRKSNVNVQWAEKLLAKYEEHTNDFFDVVSAISSEAKKVFKEKKISVQKMQNFEARYKMIKGMIELRDLSCKSISQVCENFFLTYRNTIECCNSEVCANDDNISKSDESCVENATAGKQISKNDESCEENASPGTLPSEVRESVGEVSMDEKTSVSNSDETARKVVSKEDKDDSSEDEVKTNDDLTGTISVKDVEKENNVNVKPNNKENDGDTSDTDIEIENSRQNNLNRKENESLNNCSEGNDLSSDQDNDICPRQESENCEEDSDIGLKSKKKNKKNNKKKISNKDNSRNKNSVVSDCEDFGERKRKVKKSANCNSDYENDTEDFGKDENLAICNSDKNNDSEKEKDSVSCNSDENHEDGDAENFEKVVESDSCNSDKSGEDGDAEEFKKDKDIASCNTDKNNEDCDTEIPIEDKVLASGNLENEEDCNTDVLDKNELSANCNSDTKNSIDSENENVEEKLVATSCNSGRTRLQSDNSIRLDDIDMNSIQCNDRDDSNSLHSMNKMVDKGDDNFPDIQFDGVISDLISSLSNDSQNNCKESVSNENDKDGKDLMVPPDSKSEAYSESSEKKGSLLGKDICVKNKKCTEELTDSLNNLAEEQISIDKHNRESSSNNGPLSIKESSDDSQSDAETVILSTENISANEMTGNEIEKENSELSASFGKTGNAKKIHIFSKKPSRSKNSKPHNIDKRDKNKMKNNKGIKKPVCDNSNTELCIPDDNENKSNIKNYQGAKSEGSDSDENSDNKITKEKQAMLALLLSSSDDEIYIKEEYSNNNLDDSDSESLKSSSSKGKSFPCEEKEVSHADDSSHHSSNMTISANSDERQASSKIGFNNQVRNCIVLVEKLAEDVFQKHFVDSNYLQESKKKKPTEKAQIDRLVNLKTLEASNKKKVSSASESESNQGRDINSKKTVKKEVKKKEKETLKDFHNSDSDGGSNHSDVSENSDEASSTKGRGLRNILEDLSKKNNKIAKELLLRSSSSDSDEETNELSLENKEKTKDKVKKVKVEKKEEEETTKTKEEISDSEEKMIKKGKKDDADSDDSDEIVKKKAAWRNDKLLRMKLSESDTSDDERRWEAKQLREAKERNESESDGPHLTKMNRKKTKRRRIVQSDSDVLLGSSDSSDTDSDEVFEVKSKRKRKRSSGSDKSKGSQSESETDKEEKKKPKRRRIRKPASDSSDSDGGSKNVNNSQKSDGTPNKGRKNIRRVLKEDDVADETRKAAKEEEERRKRIIEKQKMYNELYSTPEIETAVLDKLVLDFNPETKKELVEVHEALVKQLKPHQVKGIKFMWDACFESLELLKKNNGSGCILAHCMGLGKTLQVITLVHTLSNPKTKVKTVMVVCPLSTVLNWISEFSKWLDQIEDNDIEVYELTKYKQVYERVGVIKQWQTNGGVMVIGYNLYRTLTCDKSKRQKKRSRESIQEALVDPGPDLVVCDEGHLLKNEGSALSKAMNLLRTRRRIVLTGTPLQNNLLELDMSKTRWKSLRTSYLRHCKLIACRKKESTKCRKWPLADELTFLNPYLVPTDYTPGTPSREEPEPLSEDAMARVYGDPTGRLAASPPVEAIVGIEEEDDEIEEIIEHHPQDEDMAESFSLVKGEPSGDASAAPGTPNTPAAAGAATTGNGTPSSVADSVKSEESYSSANASVDPDPLSGREARPEPRSTPRPAERRKIRAVGMTNGVPATRACVRVPSTEEQESVKPKDTTRDFFLYLAETVKTFPPYLQAQVKGKCFEAVNSAELSIVSRGGFVSNHSKFGWNA